VTLSPRFLRLLVCAPLLGGCAGEGVPEWLGEAVRNGPATLVVTPSPAPAGSPIQLAGCGYAAGLSVYGEDASAAGVEYWGGVADARGCLEVVRNASLHTGSHTLSAYQILRKRTLMARTTLEVVAGPLAVTSESYTFQWDASKLCIGEDDHFTWTASGALGPGGTFVYTPRYPDCQTARAVVVEVRSSATLRVSTVVPVGDELSNDATQAGKTIAATTRGGVARLCMFPNPSFSAPASYRITVENLGATSAGDVAVTGRDFNDWLVFYWNDCLGADADGDGWSDSVEHAMAQLVYPTGNYNSGALPAGTDYLRACGTAAADDEFDAWPPDFDDDGRVTDADVARVAAHVGEGNGIPWANITPDSGPDGYWSHVGAWNRFDLDGDGWVGSSDVARARALLGARCAP
jgi:hypothetical protein